MGLARVGHALCQARVEHGVRRVRVRQVHPCELVETPTMRNDSALPDLDLISDEEITLTILDHVCAEDERRSLVFIPGAHCEKHRLFCNDVTLENRIALSFHQYCQRQDPIPTSMLPDSHLVEPSAIQDHSSLAVQHMSMHPPYLDTNNKTSRQSQSVCMVARLVQ